MYEWIVQNLVLLHVETDWEPDIFAQASSSRLSENTRNSPLDEGMTTSLEAPSRRITRSMSRGESFIPSPLSLFCITLV